MVQNYVPPPNNGEEITQVDIKRQEFEQKLTSSNWRYFYLIQEQEQESPLPGSGRGDDERP